MSNQQVQKTGHHSDFAKNSKTDKKTEEYLESGQESYDNIKEGAGISGKYRSLTACNNDLLYSLHV